MPRRLVSQVTEVELRHFCRKRTPCGYAWESVQALARKRDKRGTKKWLFAMAYLAANADSRDFFRTVREGIERAAGAELDRLEAAWRVSSGLDMLGLPNGPEAPAPTPNEE